MSASTHEGLHLKKLLATSPGVSCYTAQVRRTVRRSSGWVCRIRTCLRCSGNFPRKGRAAARGGNQTTNLFATGGANRLACVARFLAHSCSP